MIRWLSNNHPSKRKPRKQKSANTPVQPEELISKNLQENLALIREALHQSPDLKIREFTFYMGSEWKAAIVFIDGLVDTVVIHDHILQPLMVETFKIENKPKHYIKKDLSWIEKHLITVNSLTRIATIGETLNSILAGDTVLLIENFAEGLQISSKGWEKRSIEEPDTEVNIKGSREGFIENIRTNTALLRRKVGHPNLTFEPMNVGKKTKTAIALAYIRGIAREELVAEVKKRIGRIDTDAILDAGILEQYIEDAPFSLFPTINYTERPEVVAAQSWKEG